MLPDLWLQCDNCHQLSWLDPYTGLCIGCSSDEQGILTLEGRSEHVRSDSDSADAGLCGVREGSDRVSQENGRHRESKGSDPAATTHGCGN